MYVIFVFWEYINNRVNVKLCWFNVIYDYVWLKHNNTTICFSTFIWHILKFNIRTWILMNNKTKTKCFKYISNFKQLLHTLHCITLYPSIWLSFSVSISPIRQLHRRRNTKQCSKHPQFGNSTSSAEEHITMPRLQL